MAVPSRKQQSVEKCPAPRSRGDRIRDARLIRSSQLVRPPRSSRRKVAGKALRAKASRRSEDTHHRLPVGQTRRVDRLGLPLGGEVEISPEGSVTNRSRLVRSSLKEGLPSPAKGSPHALRPKPVHRRSSWSLLLGLLVLPTCGLQAARRRCGRGARRNRPKPGRGRAR